MPDAGSDSRRTILGTQGLSVLLHIFILRHEVDTGLPEDPGTEWETEGSNKTVVLIS